MGIDELLKHLNPLNEELKNRTPRYVSLPITVLKFVGLTGILHSIYSTVLLADANPETYIKSGLISAGIYLSGAAADYFALRRADKRDAQLKRRIRIKNEYQKSEEDDDMHYDKDDYEEEFEDELLDEMLDRYPTLQDPEFLKEFPNIIDVAYYIYSEIRDIKGFEEIWERFPIFYSMELTNLGQYIDFLRQGNPKVIRDYKELREKVCES